MIHADCDSDFVEAVFGEEFLQLGNGSDNGNLAVQGADFHVVIQNTIYVIAPLRVGTDTVDITFCSVAVTDNQDVFDVLSVQTQGAQNAVKGIAEQETYSSVQKNKKNHELTGDVGIPFNEVQNKVKIQKAERVCLNGF